MDDLIGRLVANPGVDCTAAERAVGIFPQFLRKEGPRDTVRALIQYMQGDDAAMSPSSRSLRSPGTFEARLLGARSVSFARDNAGEDAVGRLVGAIPGLGQSV